MLIMTPEKGKVEILLGKSFDPELHAERKSFQDGPCVLVKVLIPNERLARLVVTNLSSRAT